MGGEGGGGGVGEGCVVGGVLEQVNFFSKESKSKKKTFFFFLWGVGGSRRMDGRTGPNQYMPLQLLLSPSKSYRPVIKQTVLFQKQ